MLNVVDISFGIWYVFIHVYAKGICVLSLCWRVGLFGARAKTLQNFMSLAENEFLSVGRITNLCPHSTVSCYNYK